MPKVVYIEATKPVFSFLCYIISCYGCTFAFCCTILHLSFQYYSQEIGCEERLRNELFCVGWDRGTKNLTQTNQFQLVNFHLLITFSAA